MKKVFFRDRLVLFLLTMALLTCATGSIPSAAIAEERIHRYFYKVRDRDSISRVLYQLGIKPVYGERGTLREVLILNPEKRRTQGDAIFPGEILYLPLQGKDRLSGGFRVLATGEIVETGFLEALESGAAGKNSVHREANRSVAGYFVEPPSSTLDTPNEARDELRAAAAPDVSGPVSNRNNPDDRPSDQSIFFVPQLIYTGISARDKANGGVLRATDGNYGFRMGYTQKWTDEFSLYAVVNWYRIELRSPFAAGTTSSESSYSGFAVGTKHQLSDTWILGTSVGYQQEPVVSALSLTHLVIDRVGLPEAGFHLSKVLAKSSRQHFTLLGELGSMLTLPARTQNFEASLGYIAYGKLAARSNIGKRTRLEVGPYYRIQSLNTDLISQTLISLGLAVQFQWSLGEP